MSHDRNKDDHYGDRDGRDSEWRDRDMGGHDGNGLNEDGLDIDEDSRHGNDVTRGRVTIRPRAIPSITLVLQPPLPSLQWRLLQRGWPQQGQGRL